MQKHHLILALLSGLLPTVQAAEHPAATNQAPSVRSLGQGRFQIGLVVLDKNSRAVQFPAAVNLRDVTIEYAVVHRTGKAHESIFTTESRPQDIHLAMLLLGTKSGPTNAAGLEGRDQPLGDKVWGTATWTNNGRRVSMDLEDLVIHKETGRPLSRGEWIYNGSTISEGQFTAERDGSIISTHIDPDALINNPRPGRENDDWYHPAESVLPPLGTPTVIELRLQSKREAPH